MAKLSIQAGTTSKLVHLFVQDSSKTTGAGLAGLTNNSSGLLAHFIRAGESSSNPIAVTSAAIGTWTSGGFIEVESSAMPGLYEFGLPNAVCSANAKSAVLYMFGATNMAPNVSEIELTATNNQDAIRGGMTALPNVATGAAGAIPTVGTGTAQISVSAGMVLVQRGSAAGQLDATSGIVNANVTQWLSTAVSATTAGFPVVDVFKFGNTTVTGRDLAASVLISKGSGAGQLDVTNGIINASISTNNDKTGYALTASYDFAKGTVAMTESYAGLHAVPTPVQIMFETRALLAENTVGTVTASAATVTTKKIDGSTTAETFTLNIDGSSSPTSITRAS